MSTSTDSEPLQPSSFVEHSREDIITQLRTALDDLTSPKVDVVEFTIGDTDFCFDFSEDQ